jgi:hypothetical protein
MSQSTIYTQPEASGSRPHLQHLHTLLKSNSPDDITSPGQGSEGGRSFASLGSSESITTRARSASVQTHKVLLQVTMDNESFSVVDITGMHTADAILERVFSKVSSDLTSADIAAAIPRRRLRYSGALPDGHRGASEARADLKRQPDTLVSRARRCQGDT